MVGCPDDFLWAPTGRTGRHARTFGLHAGGPRYATPSIAHAGLVTLRRVADMQLVHRLVMTEAGCGTLWCFLKAYIILALVLCLFMAGARIVIGMLARDYKDEDAG